MLIHETARHMDLDFILSRIQTHTPYGEVEKRRMRLFGPEEVEQLEEALSRVEKCLALLGSHRYNIVEIRNQFKRIRDITGTFERIENQEVLSVTELFEVKTLTHVIEKLAGVLDALPWDIPQDLKIYGLKGLQRMLDPENTGTGTFYIYDSYSEGLKKVREDIRKNEAKILSERKSQREALGGKLGLKFRPNGEMTIPKQDKEQIKRLEDLQELVYASETYINITFKIRPTATIDACEGQIEQLKGQEEEEEYEVRRRLTTDLSTWLTALRENTVAIGKLDVLLAKAALAMGFNGVKPVIDLDGRLSIEDGRHLKVAHALARENKTFTPISLTVKPGVTCITGANMGGKTVTLKLVGQLMAMAQMGLFVPAQAMTFSPRSFFFMSIGDEQSTDKGLSTFGAEMLKIGEVLKNNETKGLILIDELARGTNPREGYAISKAIINYLKEQDSMSVITTHFDGLADDPEVKHLQVTGLSGVDFEALKEELEASGMAGIDAVHRLMDYRLKEIHGREEVPKDAINISRLMGLDETILKEAQVILGQKKL